LHQKVNGRDLVYFDNAATTQKPASVIKALTDYYEGFNANIHRGIHTLAEKATRAYEDTRVAAKNFINAQHEEEIIFVRGVTEGINLVASSYGNAFVRAGDEIIICTGGVSRRLDVPGFELTSTHSDAWSLARVPPSMVVVGAGATGVQVASIFDAFGTRVALLEAGPRILATEDEEQLVGPRPAPVVVVGLVPDREGDLRPECADAHGLSFAGGSIVPPRSRTRAIRMT
jgi:hypothetical protein